MSRERRAHRPGRAQHDPGSGNFDRHRAAHFLRRHWQERPGAAARLAARRHGRAYTRQRAHPRGDHGGRRRLPGGASVSLMAAAPPASTGVSTALQTVTWIGAITAVFAALIAVAQSDLKRILAYSTVSQLGYMMMGLGVGGVAVGLFHLLTHAFFKALLFLGAGSVIHGCHQQQDIRRLGGLRQFMPVTFATYAIGMLALSGFPLFFSGFWSKDEILHAAWLWQPSKWPFLLGIVGAFLTAFYMTRQMWFVFFGHRRTGMRPVPASGTTVDPSAHLEGHA